MVRCMGTSGNPSWYDKATMGNPRGYQGELQGGPSAIEGEQQLHQQSTTMTSDGHPQDFQMEPFKWLPARTPLGIIWKGAQWTCKTRSRNTHLESESNQLTQWEPMQTETRRPASDSWKSLQVSQSGQWRYKRRHTLRKGGHGPHGWRTRAPNM